MPPLEPDAIAERARGVFAELSGSRVWAASLEHASVDSSPLFVTSLAEPEIRHGLRRPPLPNYAIVSVRREGAVTARFAMHSEAGHLLEAEGVRRAGAVLTPFVDARELARSLLPGAALSQPSAVWRPCRESTSRFLPFWKFVVQGQDRFIRADGKLFEALTVSGLG